MIHSVNQFEWKKQVVKNILKLLFGITLPFQKHLCESGQLVFGSWRWYISVHIVDKQWNHILQVNTKLVIFPAPLPHVREYYCDGSRFISYHILKSFSLTVTTRHCQHSRSKILCTNMQHSRQNDTFCHPNYCPHSENTSISWSRVYSASYRKL